MQMFPLLQLWNEWVPVPTVPQEASLMFRTGEIMPLEAHLQGLYGQLAELREISSLQHPLIGSIVQAKVDRYGCNLDAIEMAITQIWNQYSDQLSAVSLIKLQELFERTLLANQLFMEIKPETDEWMTYGWAVYSGLISFLDLIPHLHVDVDTDALLHLADAVARIRNPRKEPLKLSEQHFSVERVIKASMAPLLHAQETPLIIDTLFDSFKSYFGTRIFAQGCIEELIEVARKSNQCIIFFKSDCQRYKLVIRASDFDLFIRLPIPFDTNLGVSYVGKVLGIKRPSDWWNLGSEVLTAQRNALQITPIGPYFREPLPDVPFPIKLVASRLNEYHGEDRHLHAASDVRWLESALPLLRFPDLEI